MQYISEWVMQIIIFILIATILELLLPNNAMKKYIHIVIGLFLLLILAKPVLYLFSIDATAELEKMEQTLLYGDAVLEQTKKQMENQKKDIQAEQAAYIWNEVREQLMEEANPVLMEDYDMHIVDISFILDDESQESNLKEVQVIVTSDEKTEQVKDVIQPVVVDLNERKQEHTTQHQLWKVKALLGQLWEMEKEQIQVLWEGGHQH